MIAPSNQMLTQGGILSRDWFSDRLQARQSQITTSHTELNCTKFHVKTEGSPSVQHSDHVSS